MRSTVDSRAGIPPLRESRGRSSYFVVPGPAELGEGLLIQFSLMTPHSRGHMRLSSADPSAAPLLDARYLNDRRHLETVVAGLDLVRQIGRAPALAAWRDQEVSPGSCRMGSDDMAVVDTDLRVRGVNGLRIADASVMPSIPSANTQATVLAIAERARKLVGSSELDAA